MLKENHMISSRRIEESDRVRIEQALARDEFHPGTKPEAFYANGTMTNVYEDAEGSVFLLRASKALRIEMLFFNNNANERNANAMLDGWAKLVESAKAGGFTEIVCSTNSEKLLNFAIKFLGLEKVQTSSNNEVELRKLL
jgi:hypothetical protein